MSPLLPEIDRRLSALYSRLAGGDDVPPSLLLRLEGLMEAAVLLDLASPEALQSRIDAVYTETFGHSLHAQLGEDWQRLHPFPQIPAHMRRAPVTPSTSD